MGNTSAKPNQLQEAINNLIAVDSNIKNQTIVFFYNQIVIYNNALNNVIQNLSVQENMTRYKDSLQRLQSKVNQIIQALQSRNFADMQNGMEELFVTIAENQGVIKQLQQMASNPSKQGGSKKRTKQQRNGKKRKTSKKLR